MNVKGTALAVLPIFIESKFGQEGLNKWLESLNSEAVALYKDSNTIKVNQWYPLKESYLEPTAALCELFYNNDPKGAWEVGRFSADYALKGVYKAFVKMTSVSFFIKRASLLMTTSLPAQQNGAQIVHLQPGSPPHDRIPRGPPPDRIAHRRLDPALIGDPRLQRGGGGDHQVPGQRRSPHRAYLEVEIITTH